MEKLGAVGIQMVLVMSLWAGSGVFQKTGPKEIRKCEDFLRAYVTINETDPPETLLFWWHINTSNMKLTFNVKDPSALASRLKAYFRLENKGGNYMMKLTKTIDMEAFNSSVNPSAISLIMTCTIHLQSLKYDFFVIVLAVSEFWPYFKQSLYRLNVSEEAAFGTTVIDMSKEAADDDIKPYRPNDILYYRIVPYQDASKPQRPDGSRLFDINARTGIVTVKGRINLETTPIVEAYFLNVSVTDSGYLVNYTILEVTVLDIDDILPEFYSEGCSRPCAYVIYTATILSSYLGPITNVQPSPIAARDGDTLNSVISYSIVRGSDPSSTFQINSATGVVSVVKPISSSASEFLLMIQANEVPRDSYYMRTVFHVIIIQACEEEIEPDF